MDLNEQILKINTIHIRDGREVLPRHPTKEWSKRDPLKLLGVVIHQSLENYGSASGNARYHSGPNHISDDGLPGLSYTMFVEKSGLTYLANSVEDKTLSQGSRKIPGDENALYLGICFGGNFSAPGYEGPQEPTEEQIKTLKLLWEGLKPIWGFKNNQLFGHYDFGKTTCPGTILSNIIEDINKIKDWDEPEFNLSTLAGRQAALSHLGYYDGSIDGDWGPMSRYALTKFQENAGLMSDGVWGKKTDTAIMLALNI